MARRFPIPESWRIDFHREEDGRWIADVPALPGATAYGETRDQAEKAVRMLALRVMLDREAHGEEVPERLD